MPPLDSDTVLRTEANEIHRGKLKSDGAPVAPIGADVGGAALYRALHERNASARGTVRPYVYAPYSVNLFSSQSRPESCCFRTLSES